MPSKKHYIITAITLSAIAAASGLLIGAANLITRDQIKKNEVKKFNAGIAAIFGEGAYTADFNPKIENDKYLVSSYHVHNNELNSFLEFYLYNVQLMNMCLLSMVQNLCI